MLWASPSAGFREEKEWRSSDLFWPKLYEKIKERRVIQKGIDFK